ncbi:MAG TPA: hypothetical protein VND87_06075 [Stellaceae bacterium]|nr:hypothetical protein [Stellaceae bacterium]
MRIGWGTAAMLVAGLASATAVAASNNAYNDTLLKMKPAIRTARLAQIVGYWCVGTNAYYMGIAEQGPEAGYAYWSLSCLDSGSYAIQIDPHGQWTAITCEQLAAEGQGRECFKKF